MRRGGPPGDASKRRQRGERTATARRIGDSAASGRRQRGERTATARRIGDSAASGRRQRGASATARRADGDSAAHRRARPAASALGNHGQQACSGLDCLIIFSMADDDEQHRTPAAVRLCSDHQSIPDSAAPDPQASTLGYLGPAGTFTEQAVYSQPDLACMNHRPINSILDVLQAVSTGEVDLGLVAIENMIEGSVTATLDALAFDTDLFIQREVIIDVNLNLLAHPGVEMEAIKRVRSYPVAHAQCREYLAKHLPRAVFEASNSTAEAARDLAGCSDMTSAVIAPPRSAEVYGLDIVAGDIADRADNQTRFVLVAANGIPEPTGHDKTSLVVYQRSDVPGSLIGILQEFAARAINLTSLQSRPTKASLGQYCFLLDCEGHIANELVADALRNLRMKTAEVKFLGSYPSASVDERSQERNKSEVRNAESWIEGLRSLIRH